MDNRPRWAALSAYRWTISWLERNKSRPDRRRRPFRPSLCPAGTTNTKAAAFSSACPLIHINLGQYGVHWARGVTASGNPATASHIATGGAASAHIAIGDAVEGTVPSPKEGWGPGTSAAIQAVILRKYPGTPPLLVWPFSQVP